MTTEFADVLGMVRTYLASVLPVPVSTRVADPRPSEFVRVRRVGGQVLMPVRESVRVDVVAWALTEVRAMWLLNQARSALWSLHGGLLGGSLPVYDVDEFMSPQQLDDRDTGLPLAMMTIELVVRADLVTPPRPQP
jgi:hypothetical protein